MSNLKISNNIQNRIIYQSSSLALYMALYVMLSALLKGFYNPVLGASCLVIALFSDIYFSGKRLRIYLRFILITVIYALLYMILIFFSNLTTSPGTYNIFDKIPYIVFRDSIVSLVFILFYFIFDATHIRQRGRITYWLSTVLLLASFFLALKGLNPDEDILKSVFKNYFNYFLCLVAVVGLFIARHVAYIQDRAGRKLFKKDIMLLLLLLLPVIVFLFFFTLQNHINKNNKSNSALFNQSLFQFDFSNFVELKDEIKMSDDKVLIMELSGVNTDSINRINQGWDKQIYLKRYSLEEYSGGGFRVSEKLSDPDSPPVYLSGFMWEIPKKPVYKARTDILETLYLINIDASSLMGSDLLSRIVPVTNYEGSSYKQIYKSFCYVLTKNYKDLMSENLTQKEFLKKLPPERKKLLLEWDGGKSEKKIKELAENITSQYDDPYYKALSIQIYLWDNYYYTLKPGFASDGDQLGHFLFDPLESGGKKGYCTYFAFAMSLMLRSIGIPARVAVGFAPDMKNSTLNFYEIRAMDGHAWVEVFFDGYGWVTFDPTSSNFAPGEEYQFAMGNKEERDKYIEEILKNKDKMKDILKKSENKNVIKDIASTLSRSIKMAGLVLFFIILGGFFGFVAVRKNYNRIRYFLSHSERKKAIFLFRHFLGKLLDLGYPVKRSESIEEYCRRIKDLGITDLAEATTAYQTALFRENLEFTESKESLLDIYKKVSGDLKKLGTKKRLFAFFSISRAWKRILPIILTVLFLNTIPLHSEEYNLPSLDAYMNQARKELDGNFFDKALEILSEAEKKYPESYEPNLMKADTYFDHELNENALIEYLKVEKKGFATETVYQSISTCYSRTGEDKPALDTLKNAFEMYNGDCSENFFDDLGWQYYKNHQVNEGLKIIAKGLKKFPKSSDLYMTLGTLYSDMWEYENSKNAYINSINYSYDNKTNNFRSIAYYNLSLLENSFLYYQEAHNSANASISQANRSSPHLELNYLYMDSLELGSAYRESKFASSLQPKTLFPEMSIAYIKVFSGQIDEGIKLLKDLLVVRDFSWMAYFGTNKDSYYSEIYRTLYQAYLFKYNQVKYNDRDDIVSTITRPFRRIYFLGASYYYNFRFTNLNVKIGEDVITGGSELEGLKRLYDSYERLWPGKAIKLLGIIRNIEKETNPRNMKTLDIKKAILRKQTDFFYSEESKKTDILKNLVLLDPRWEKQTLCDSYIELITASKGEERKELIKDLFSIHPPLVPMAGFDIEMSISMSNINDRDKKTILKALDKSGIKSSTKSGIILDLNLGSGKLSVNLSNNGKYIKNFSVGFKDKSDTDKLKSELFKNIFVYELSE